MRTLKLLYHYWRHGVWLERARSYVGRNGYTWGYLPDHIEEKLRKHLWAIDRLRGNTVMGIVDRIRGRC